MPRHIRNILIAALLAVLALAAGINGYIHHQFKTNIDSAFASVRPFVTINYSDLTTSALSGKVELKNVRFTGAFLPETITLGNVTLETPGFAYMLSGPNEIKSGEFPEHFGFAIDDFYLDLHGETAEWLDRLVKRMQPIYANERKLCAGKSIFGPSDYKEMGYTRLLSNLRLAYDFNKSKKSLNIQMNAGTRNMGEIKADINILNIDSMSSTGVMQAGLPQLASVEVTYKDQTYAPRIVKYCSELSEMKKEDFVDAEVKQSDEYFYMIWGFAPGEGLREAYKDFLLKPDLVTLTMSPEKDFNLMSAPTMSSEELLEALNVHLKINGLLTPDLSFKSPPPEFTAKFEQRLASALNFNSLLRGDPIKAPEPVKPKKSYKRAPAKYHKISLSQIPKHIGSFVIITTKNGKKRKGRLTSVDKLNLYVEKKVSGGKFTMTVNRPKIVSIEAYFSK